MRAPADPATVARLTTVRLAPEAPPDWTGLLAQSGRACNIKGEPRRALADALRAFLAEPNVPGFARVGGGRLDSTGRFLPYGDN